MVLVAGRAWAVPVCNGTSPGERPDFNSTTESGWTISASAITLIKCLVSIGPNGNQVPSNYWAAATTTDMGPSTPNTTINNSGNGLTVIGNTPTHNGTSNPGDT